MSTLASTPVERLGPPPGRQQITALTGLRFVAALVVVVSHYPELVPISGLAVALDRQGGAGVNVFFVLSGFVLTYSYFDTFRHTPRGSASFLRARLARIFPMHVAALILVTPVILLIASERPSLRSWFVNVTMLQALIPVEETQLWNIPSWSVSAELIFYCLFPMFIYLVLGRIRRPRRLLALGASMFLIEITLFSAVTMLGERELQARGRTPEEISTIVGRAAIFPGLRIWEFFLGCVVGLAFLRSRSGDHRGWWRLFEHRRVRDGLILFASLCYLGIVLFPSLVRIPTHGLYAHIAETGLYVVYTPLAILLVSAVAWGPTVLSPVLEHRSMQVLGDASYSLYLLQWIPYVIITGAAWAPNPRVWWFSGPAILLLIGFSILTTRWIEKPARSFLRGGAPTTLATVRAPDPVSAAPVTMNRAG